MSQTTIVVPCYNEEQRFQPDAFRKHATRWPADRFLFVDDGSTDGTAEVLARLCAGHSAAFQVIQLDRNRGKAEAVRQGILAALEDGPEYVGYWDADLATPLDSIPEFRHLLEDRPHVEAVLGSRVRLLGREIHRRPWRHYLGRCFATAASLVLGIGVYDTQCGAKLFRVTPRTTEIFRRPFSTSWIFDVELLARFLETGSQADLYEFVLPQWSDRTGSKLRLRHFLRAGLDLLVLYWEYRSGLQVPHAGRTKRPGWNAVEEPALVQGSSSREQILDSQGHPR